MGATLSWCSAERALPGGHGEPARRGPLLSRCARGRQPPCLAVSGSPRRLGAGIQQPRSPAPTAWQLAVGQIVAVTNSGGQALQVSCELLLQRRDRPPDVAVAPALAAHAPGLVGEIHIPEVGAGQLTDALPGTRQQQEDDVITVRRGGACSTVQRERYFDRRRVELHTFVSGRGKGGGSAWRGAKWRIVLDLTGLAAAGGGAARFSAGASRGGDQGVSYFGELGGNNDGDGKAPAPECGSEGGAGIS